MISSNVPFGFDEHAEQEVFEMPEEIEIDFELSEKPYLDIEPND